MLCGGQAVDGPGWFYQPTVVADMTPDMAMYADEVFGPVAGLYRVARHRRGRRPGQRHQLRPGLQRLDHRPRRAGPLHRATSTPGVVTINGMTVSYLDLPFGGTKRSGYGRELSAHGIREFTNIKAVWIG